jgi:hypothetical protein
MAFGEAILGHNIYLFRMPENSKTTNTDTILTLSLQNYATDIWNQRIFAYLCSLKLRIIH